MENLWKQVKTISETLEKLTNKVDEHDERILTVETSVHDLQMTVKPESKETESYLLTRPQWGESAYLVRTEDDTWKVMVADEVVTHGYSDPHGALKDYINNSKENDFIIDFVIGAGKGECDYGSNVYAVYVKKLFEACVIERDF